MSKINIRRIIYRLRHDYFTLNNLVVVAALMVAAGWAWGSIGYMQRNYSLQRELDASKRELQLVELQVQNLEFEKKYHQTEEFQELAARDRLGLAMPGESVLILPPNTVQEESGDAGSGASLAPVAPSNVRQWVNFLFGGSVRSLK